MPKKKGISCNPGTWLGCIVADQIKQSDQQARIEELKRQKRELQAQLEAFEASGHSPGPRNRRGRQVLALRNNARPKRGQTDRKTRREVFSVGGSMDETQKLQGHIDLLQEQQKIQTERMSNFKKEKAQELAAKDLEIVHLRERLLKMEEEKKGLAAKAVMIDEQSDNLENMRLRVRELEKKLEVKERTIKNLDTNPQKFMDLQKYVHETLTRYVENIMRSLDDCKKSQKEAYTIIADLRKAITTEIAQKVEALHKQLNSTSEENEAWTSRISQQDQQLQKLRQEVMKIRNRAHKLEVSFETYKQQRSLQMLSRDSSSIGSGTSPQLKSSVDFDEKSNKSSSSRVGGMKAELSRVESAAIAKQTQIEAMGENNKFMRKELQRRSQQTETYTNEIITVSRKNINANGHLNRATRRIDSTQSMLQEQIEPNAVRSNELVSNLAESLANQDLKDGIDVQHGLSRSKECLRKLYFSSNLL